MTLRLRLVLALLALVFVGLALFGLATYSLYARSQYDRLDDQVRSSVPFVTRQLAAKARLGGAGADGAPTSGGGRSPGGDTGNREPPSPLPVVTYSELRDHSGAVITSDQVVTSTTKPRLPARIDPVPPAKPHLFTTGSAHGSGQWRVFVTAAPGLGDRTVVVAVPSEEVSTALHRLTVTEISGGAALLAILCSGAWLILRRGLRPLERMATTASEIAAGDLSQRVDATPPASEIGRLGSALNVMLERIERAFAERDATEQRLRQFLSDASHELRTPLTSIQGFAELYRIGDRERIDLGTILRRIEEESARMSILVEDLLLLARLDETRPVERAPVDVAVLAADACSDAVAAAPDRPVTLDAPEPLVVLGDEALLRQAIANLVSNAVRHTPPATAIDVSARRRDGDAVVVVRDHGPGLSDEAAARAFDRFWRADRARSGASTGLGLSIVAGIAAEHGGSVFAGNAEDGGAVFMLRLPVR